MSKIICVATISAIAIGALLVNAQERIQPWMQAASDVEMGHAQPILDIDHTEYDFGQVHAGGHIEASFQIRNLANQRLILRQTNGDCDCFTAGKPEIVIAPHGSRTITLTLDTSKSSGAQSTRIHYWTNDPRRPRLCLVCSAVIDAR